MDGLPPSVQTLKYLPAQLVSTHQGKIVTPGLFSSVGRLGLIEVPLSASSIDNEQRGSAFTAGFDVSSAYNPSSTLVAVNRIEGVTSAVTMPGPASDNGSAAGHVISGQAAVVNLGDDNWLTRSAAGIVVTLGQSGSAYAGGNRAAAFMYLRTALAEAADYARHKGDFERGLRREYSYNAVDLEALQPVLAGEIPLIANVHRVSDMEALLGLASEYNVRVVINGGTEAWMIADKLAAANVPVLAAVTDNLPSSFDRLNARRGALNVLLAAGVNVAIAESRSQTHNARNLTQAAGNAVADGLDREAALRAITLAPAEIYGVADQVGSIEVGKSADVVIWPADPFELTTYADQVYIGGEAIPMHSRQTLLRDRYLDPGSDTPPAWRK